MRLSLRNLYQFFRDMGHVLINGELDSPDLIILDEEEVVFVSVAKSACSSIKASITEDPPTGRTIHDHISHLSIFYNTHIISSLYIDLLRPSA